MELSFCAVLGLAVLGVTVAAASLFAGMLLVSRLADMFKACQENFEKLKYAPVGMSVGVVVCYIALIVSNTTGWKPCGEDTISRAIQSTPVQVVASTIPCNCGCGRHK